MGPHCSSRMISFDQGLLHRDLKLDNCLMSSDEVAKIGDFGLAKTKPENETSMTFAGTISTMCVVLRLMYRQPFS